MKNPDLPPGYKDMFNFGLIEALLGRRSRRFFMGAQISDGVFAFKSKQEPLPLSELNTWSDSFKIFWNFWNRGFEGGTKEQFKQRDIYLNQSKEIIRWLKYLKILTDKPLTCFFKNLIFHLVIQQFEGRTELCR